MQNYSRRQVAASFLSLLGCRFHLNAQSDAAEAATQSTSPSENSVNPQRAKLRRYRADAAILLLGMTVYRRSAVGDGEASIEDTGEGPSLRRTLFFAAGSDPKRARGLSRLGWMREIVSRQPHPRSATPACSPRLRKRPWTTLASPLPLRTPAATPLVL